MTLHFTVIGVARQMGSKRAFVPKGHTRPIITDSNKNLKAWQQLVAEHAAVAIGALPKADRVLSTEGMRLTIAFYLPRPQSLRDRVTAHTKAPDLDKLVRATQDAIEQVVYANDSQVCDLVAMKRYAAPGAVPRAEVWIEPSAGLQPLARAQHLFQMQPGLFAGEEG